jgi:hypothetical protein
MARFDEFKWAFWLFVTAVVVALVAGVWWEITDNGPFFVRIVIGCVTSLAIFVVMPMLLAWLWKKEREWQSKQRQAGLQTGS